MIPEPASRRSEQRAENARLFDALPPLEHRGPADSPADEAFAVVEQVVDLRLCQFLDRPGQISEMNRFERLDPKRDLVGDTREAIARAELAQQFGVAAFRRLGELACGRYPLDVRDVGAHLAEFDAVERVLGVATCGRPKRHVANLDIRHELQVALAQRIRRVDELHPGLCRKRLVRLVDFDDPVHALHVEYRAVSRDTGRQGVAAPHRPHWARESRSVAQDLLNLLDGVGAHDLLRRHRDAAVVIDNRVWHALS